MQYLYKLHNAQSADVDEASKWPTLECKLKQLNIAYNLKYSRTGIMYIKIAAEYTYTEVVQANYKSSGFKSTQHFNQILTDINNDESQMNTSEHRVRTIKIGEQADFDKESNINNNRLCVAMVNRVGAGTAVDIFLDSTLM